MSGAPAVPAGVIIVVGAVLQRVLMHLSALWTSAMQAAMRPAPCARAPVIVDGGCMADMLRREAPPGGAYPIVVNPEVYERLRAIAEQQAISIDTAAQMLLVDALRRAGRWRAGAGEGQSAGE